MLTLREGLLLTSQHPPTQPPLLTNNIHVRSTKWSSITKQVELVGWPCPAKKCDGPAIDFGKKEVIEILLDSKGHLGIRQWVNVVVTR